MMVCGAAMQPAWPAPLTPSGFTAVGSSARVMSSGGRSSARGKLRPGATVSREERLNRKFCLSPAKFADHVPCETPRTMRIVG